MALETALIFQSINDGVFDFENPECIRFVESFTSVAKFAKEFRRQFDYVVAYHGTNLSQSEMDSIRLNGMLKPTKEFMKQKALSRFVHADDSAELKQQLTDFIEGYFDRCRMITLGELNFSWNKQLVYEHYHYLLFGPESLLPLAGELKDRFRLPFRTRMIDYGHHVLASVKIPIAHVRQVWLRCLYEYINGDFPEASIVIKKQVKSGHIINLEMVSRPYDSRGFEYM